MLLVSSLMKQSAHGSIQAPTAAEHGGAFHLYESVYESVRGNVGGLVGGTWSPHL